MTLKSWRELLATPLTEAPLKGADDVSGENLSDKSDKSDKSVLLREHLSETVLGQIAEVSDKLPALPRSRLVRIGPNAWKESEWARGLCVFCDDPVAGGDVLACEEHRARLDATVMPWEER